jgi:uncharacterized protein
MTTTLHALNYTLLFAGLCALLQCLLTALVIARRLQARVSLLDGGDKPLIKRIRAHGNFIETAPMALLLLALLEFNSLATWAVIGFGSLLVIGRVLHAMGLINNRMRWARMAGMLMTIFVISIQAVCCLWLFFKI